MKRKALLFSFVFAAALGLCSNAYAGLGDENCPIRGFCETTGKVIHNILPWNWGKSNS
jgi:hypothetical protein